MHPTRKRRIALGIGATLFASAVLVPLCLWRMVSYEPDFYRARAAVPPERVRAEAKNFVDTSIRLRNDIVNEGRWEASFTAEEVNAWMSEELVEHFAELIPPGVHDPMVAFELDRVTLAFKLRRGPFTSLVWVVARARVPADNTVALTIEKIRAGALPVRSEEVLDAITYHARANGLDIHWAVENGEQVAYIHYEAHPGRVDVVLERVQVLDGRIYVGGRSDRGVGRISGLSLPDRRILQSTFPMRKSQPARGSSPPSTRRISSASPVT